MVNAHSEEPNTRQRERSVNLRKTKLNSCFASFAARVNTVPFRRLSLQPISCRPCPYPIDARFHTATYSYVNGCDVREERSRPRKHYRHRRTACTLQSWMVFAGWHSLQGAHMPDGIQMPVYGNHGFGRKSGIKWTLSMAKWIYKRGHVYDNILPQEERRTDAGNRALWRLPESP